MYYVLTRHALLKIYPYIVDIPLLLGCFITSRLKLFTLDFEVSFAILTLIYVIYYIFFHICILAKNSV